MKKTIIASAVITSLALVAPAMADSDYTISEEPLELTVHMHAKQYPG